jgi:dihydrofolate synthase/folylpolyglutamate synthase
VAGTDFDPDAYLDSLEPIGWRLGLERMRKLSTALGMPQHRFGSIHVVGTNGKSSVTRMIAALLEAHGVGSGACLSPHTARWSERALIHGEEIGAVQWAEAVETVATAAVGVNRTLEDGDAVTQFEAATAATFLALAAIEAGLGGRLDATNTIPSRVTVLSSIGLDHTEWLGETELEIAAEKLAVLRDQTTLVLGRVSPEVAALAERTAAQRRARLVRAPEDPGGELRVLAPGGFQRRNFALARSAAEAFLGRLEPALVAEVAATVSIPGRLERIGERPPTYIDAAHNPDGVAALAEALPAVVGGRRVVACLAILADKDAAAMVRALAPALERAVCTELPAAALAAHGRPGARSRPATELVAACEAVGLAAEAEPSFEAALRRASSLAAEPPEGAVLVTGSHYGIAPARSALGADPAPARRRESR